MDKNDSNEKELIGETGRFKFYWLPKVGGMMVFDINRCEYSFYNQEHIDDLINIIKAYRKGKEEISETNRFTDYLKQASETVSKWPKWKQEIL